MTIKRLALKLTAKMNAEDPLPRLGNPWPVVLLFAACLVACRRELPPAATSAGAVQATSASEIRFVEVAEEAGVRFTYSSGHDAEHHTILQSLGGGVAIFDYDGDEQLDLMFAGGGDFVGKRIIGKPPLLMRNTGDARFEDVTVPSYARVATHYTHGCHAADYDNDGFMDLLVTGYGGLQLFHNLGDGTFRELHDAAGLDDDSWSTSAAWGDLNADGALDLYVCHYVNWSFDNHPYCEDPTGERRDICPPKRFEALDDIVYYANGDGSFRDATEEAGLVGGGNGLGVVAADLDLDGDLDIYVANDETDNFLYVNNGHGVFQEVGVLNGVSGDDVGEVNGSMGVDVGDYNADGLPDIWVANYVEEPFALYKNLGRGQFQHVSKSAGVNSLGGVFVGFGTGFVDVDCDGDEDLVVSNGHVVLYPSRSTVRQVPLLLLNEGRARYRRFEFAGTGDNRYFTEPHLGRGLAWGDLDDDGDLDFVVSHLQEPSALLRNDVPRNSQRLRVKLVGRDSNRDAIGATAKLTTSDGMQLRLIKGGGSYLSQPDKRLYWAVPAQAKLQALTISWPCGGTTTMTDVALNANYTVIEPLRDATSTVQPRAVSYER
ncbi:MAG: CRTAC1 family protein [Pirellulaceae bacterium]